MLLGDLDAGCAMEIEGEVWGCPGDVNGVRPERAWLSSRASGASVDHDARCEEARDGEDRAVPVDEGLRIKKGEVE
jgi:hypothetical protein